MKPNTATFLSAVVVTCLATATLQAQPLYELVPLTLMNTSDGGSGGAGISPDGSVIVGSARPHLSGATSAVKGRPCFWQNGHPQVLPRAAAPSSGINNYASRINARGTIAGALSYGSDLIATRAVLWQGAGAIDLGTLPGDEDSKVQGLNDHDVVVGQSGPLFFSPGAIRAFQWADGLMQELPVLSGTVDATAYDVNNHGTAVGTSGEFFGFPFPSAIPVVWENGIAADLPLPVGAPDGMAMAINDAGVIAGMAGFFESIFFNTQMLPVRWDENGPAYLPLPAGYTSGQVRGMNQAGDIVGASAVFDLFGFNSEASLWISEEVYLLSELTLAPEGWSWAFSSAEQISDSGHIVGTGTLNGVQTAFVAIPIE